MAVSETTVAYLRAPCPQCGGSVASNGSTFCSRECQWASMRTRPVLTCAGCGAAFVKRRRSSKDAQRYCSRSCSVTARRRWASKADARRARKARATARRREANGIGKPRVCIGCANSFIAKSVTHVRCTPTCQAAQPDKASRTCRQCAATFTPKYGDKRRVFCSARCLRRSVKPQGGKSDRKRARRAGVEYEPVSRLKVFARDGWRCQVCGRTTPKRLKGTLHERAPELDHRVPLAMGGAHAYHNCQLACRKCNGEKGGHRVAGQADLFPNP